MQASTKVKATEIVIDWDIYPRGSYDAQYAAVIADSYRADEEIPAIILDRKTNRVVDGLHRFRARMKAFGNDCDVPCILRTFNSEREIVVFSARSNARHGKRMNSFDRMRCMMLLEKHKVGPEDIADIFGMTTKTLIDLRAQRMAKTRSDGEIPLKATISHMAGKLMTKRQQEANVKLSGMQQIFYVNQIIELIEADLIDTSNERLIERLRNLSELMEVFV